jgi:hypothetical protein
MQIGTGYQYLLELATKVSSKQQIYDLYISHVLSKATATLARFLLRKKFPRLRFGLSYPLEYGFMMLYTLASFFVGPNSEAERDASRATCFTASVQCHHPACAAPSSKKFAPKHTGRIVLAMVDGAVGGWILRSDIA